MATGHRLFNETGTQGPDLGGTKPVRAAKRNRHSLVGFIHLMRALITVLVAASLSATAAQAEPLAAGRPAGIHAARLGAWNTAVMLGTGALIMTAVGILASRNSSAVNSEHFDSNAVPFQPTIGTTATS